MTHRGRFGAPRPPALDGLALPPAPMPGRERGSERTVWIDGEPGEVGPVRFAPDLSAVGGLRFAAEAQRSRRENLGLVRSRYRQPFGTFSGTLPGPVALAEGYGVMEAHDVWW